jgi:hypothetical protein
MVPRNWCICVGYRPVDWVNVAFSRANYKRRRWLLVNMTVLLAVYMMIAPRFLGSIQHGSLTHLMCPCSCLMLPPWYQARRTYATLLEVSPGTFEVVDEDDYEASLRRGSAPIKGTRRADVRAVTEHWTVGLLAPVVLTYEVEPRIIPADSAELTATERAKAHLAFADFLETSRWADDHRYAELLRRGTGPVREILWPGLIHDVVYLLVLLFWLWIALWKGFALRVWMQSRRTRARQPRREALDANRCPACYYDISGLPQGGGHRCPECAEALWR